MNSNGNNESTTLTESGYGEVREIEATPGQKARTEVRELVQEGKHGEALTVANRMQAEKGIVRETIKKLNKQLALEVLDAPGELDLPALVDALEAMEKDDKPTVTFEDATDNFEAKFPDPILKAHNQGGAILSAGEVCILSAQGGAGKSTLACALSMQFASMNAQKPEPLGWNLFDGFGGGVVYITKEDTTGVLRKRMQLYAKHIDKALPENTLSRVKMAYISEPIFGVPEGAHQGVRPEKLPMWDAVWEQIYNLPEPPKLIIFDTISKIYAASQIEPGGVNGFVDDLKMAAGKIGAGVLLIGHSNKEARKKPDPFEPGQVSGTGAWHDAVRGVMTLTYTDLGLILAIPKANYGKPDMWLELNTLRAYDKGMPLAYEGKNEWQGIVEYYDRIKQAQQDKQKGKNNGATDNADLDLEAKDALNF